MSEDDAETGPDPDDEVLEARPSRGAAPRVIGFQFSGPLPIPSMLAAYKKADPEFITWVKPQAEQEVAHRHALELDRVAERRERFDSELRVRLRGQLFGFVVAILGLTGSSAAIVCSAIYDSTPAATAGGVLGGATLVGLVTAFLATTRRASGGKTP